MKIIGHIEIREKLKNLIKNEKVSHAYLFYGKAGIGKSLVAIEFAKNMMCLNKNEGVSCGICEACKTYENNGDFHIIKPEKDIIKVRAEIYCEKEAHKSILIGKNGAKLKKIGTYAREDAEKMFGIHMHLDLWVKVKENWRDRRTLLADFGYNNEE